MCLLDEHVVEGAAVVSEALRQTGEAFDSVAETYEAANRSNPALLDMRRRTRAVLMAHVPAGARLLDLGCGPGADAAAFAQAGYHVTAIDWSAAMIAEAGARVAAAGLNDRVQLRRTGIHEFEHSETPFDAAYSTLGPLNCVPDLADAAHRIARAIRPDGLLIASVIGRVCPWEVALFTWRRDWPRLRVRFAPGLTPVPLNGRTVWTRYYTVREFTRAFAGAGFARVSVRALGLFVPPPYMEAFARRHPALISRLQRLDDGIGGWWGLRTVGDHFLIVMRKTQ